MGIQFLDGPESREQNWLDSTLTYLNRQQMRASKSYQRVRGEASMSSGEGVSHLPLDMVTMLKWRIC